MDILDNICRTDGKNFEGYNKLNSEQVEQFLDSLDTNLDKLRFFSDIGISKINDKNFYDYNLVDKMY